jgi:hypothetical protein
MPEQSDHSILINIHQHLSSSRNSKSNIGIYRFHTVTLPQSIEIFFQNIPAGRFFIYGRLHDQ